MTIKVNYDPQTTLVKGYYPNSVNYASIPEPFIEIEDDEQDNSKQMCVVDGVYQEYIKPLDAQLQEAKTFKITQLKLNRDNANTKDMVSHQAFELKQIGRYEFVETTNLVYFAFQTKDTGQPATQPDTIVQNAIASDQPMRYSCKIIEGDQIRKGYVSFDKLVAISIRDHALLRNIYNITECNNIEIDINACTTLDELNAINITL